MSPRGVRVVVGGVGHLYQGDLDLGRVAVERLQHEDLGADVAVEEFSYGAVAVSQRLEELRPELLVLVAAKARGREPGSVERRELQPVPRTPEALQGAVADSVTGYIDIDLVVDVANGFGALPPHVITVEVEPARTEPAERLSPQADAALARALELVRDEVRVFAEGARVEAGLMELRDVLLETLAEILDVEEKLRDETLPELLGKTSEKHFREAIEEHLLQTKRHVTNVDRAFGVLGSEPRRTRSRGLEALKQQHHELLSKVESPEVRDIVNAAAGAHTEHHEISAYHTAITVATMLGEPEVVGLLERNLHEEEEALAKLEKSIPERLSTRLTAAGLGVLE